MSGTIGTNVTTDGSAEFDFLNKILSMIENRQLAASQTEEAKNVRKIADHIAQGGQGSYKLVNRKFEKAIREKLKEKKIPYTVIHDDKGNAGFVVRDVDEASFVKIQHDVFAMDTAYYAQIPKDDLCRIAKVNKDKDLVTLHFETEAAFNEAQIKLYGSGVVCAIDKNEKALYINPADLYSPYGNDLASFELEWAVNQSMNDEMFGGNPAKGLDSPYQQLRNAQAEHDLQMIKAFSEAVQSKERKVMIDARNTSATYMECDRSGLSIFKQDKSGEWNETAHFDANQISEMGADGVGSVISKFGFDITNAIVVDSKDKNFILNATKETAAEWSKAWAQEKDANGNPIQVRAGFCRQLRPYRNFTADTKEVMTLKRELKKVTSAVNREARERVEAKIGDKFTSPIQKRELVKKEVVALLQEGRMPELYEFLNKQSEYVTKDVKIQWIDNICEHFENQAEVGQYELQITKTNVKELERQEREKIAEKILGSNKTKESPESELLSAE